MTLVLFWLNTTLVVIGWILLSVNIDTPVFVLYLFCILAIFVGVILKQTVATSTFLVLNKCSSYSYYFTTQNRHP